MTTQVFQKEIDDQGRILLPKEWRHQIKSNKVVIIVEDTILKILPETKKLTSFISKAKPSTLKENPFENYGATLAEASIR